MVAVSRKRVDINILALLGSVLMILAMFFPWWSFAMEFNDPTYLYPYLLDGPATEIIGYKRSPQMALLTGVLFACILLALIGAFSPKRRSRWLLIASAVLNSLAVWRLLVRIAGVAALYHMPIQGEAVASYGGFAKVKVWSQILPGLYLDVTGILLVLLGAILLWTTFIRLDEDAIVSAET
jgi:hypothetical protein